MRFLAASLLLGVALSALPDPDDSLRSFTAGVTATKFLTDDPNAKCTSCIMRGRQSDQMQI
jgi:hypothetical protein